MKKLRIGIVAFDQPGYTESFFVRMIELLQSPGHEVTLFIPHREGAASPEFTTRSALPTRQRNFFSLLQIFLIFSGRLLFSPLRAWRFLSSERELKVPFSEAWRNLYLTSHIWSSGMDHIHFFYLFNAIGKESLGRAMKIKLSASVRGDDVVVYPVQHPGCYARLPGRIDLIHCVSQAMKSYLPSFGLGQAEVMISGGSIPIGPSTYVPEADKNRLRLFTVGRLTEQKGLEIAIEAMALFLQAHPECDLKYIIAGEGELRGSLEQLVREKKLESVVELPGIFSKEEVWQTMGQTGIYLQPSRWEGLCNATREAMGCGLPVIVSDIPTFTEFISEGYNGYFFKVDDANSLCRKMEEVWKKDAEEMKKVSRQARETIETKFSVEVHKVFLAEMLRRLGL